MKPFIFIVSLLLTSVAFGQDYCKQIKKEVRDNNKSFNYETPYDENNPPAIRASRSFGQGEEEDFDNFNLVLTIPCEFSDLLTKNAEGHEAEKDEYKIVIEFDDKSKITDDTTLITHEKKGDGSALRMAYLTITPKTLGMLTSKKIAKIYLAAGHMDVPADLAKAMQAYLICLRDVKK